MKLRESTDRSAPSAPALSTQRPPEPKPALALATAPVAVFEPKPIARDRASIEAALAELRARYEKDAPHQFFVTDHHSIVFHDGDPMSRLMFIGEAPGADEDRTGVPFVGRAGQLLNKMIAAMGMTRDNPAPEGRGVYIANVLKTRPPDNATPTSDEIRLCAPYLYEQIRIVSPAAIVTLGLPATRALLNTMDAMSRLRGIWHMFTPPGGSPIPVMPTYHPAFLLRAYTDDNRKKVWSDLQMAMSKLGITLNKKPNIGDA